MKRMQGHSCARKESQRKETTISHTLAELSLLTVGRRCNVSIQTVLLLRNIHFNSPNKSQIVGAPPVCTRIIVFIIFFGSFKGTKIKFLKSRDKGLFRFPKSNVRTSQGSITGSEGYCGLTKSRLQNHNYFMPHRSCGVSCPPESAT